MDHQSETFLYSYESVLLYVKCLLCSVVEISVI